MLAIAQSGDDKKWRGIIGLYLQSLDYESLSYKSPCWGVVLFDPSRRERDGTKATRVACLPSCTLLAG